jgi:hypothetical protein
MIYISVRPGFDPLVSGGLIPGQTIHLTIDGKTYLVHRHGESSHAHELMKGEIIDANTRPAQTDST